MNLGKIFETRYKIEYDKDKGCWYASHGLFGIYMVVSGTGSYSKSGCLSILKRKIKDGMEAGETEYYTEGEVLNAEIKHKV